MCVSGCNLVGRNNQGEIRLPQQQCWRYPGALYSNVLGRHHRFFVNNCRHSRIDGPYLEGCNRNIMNTHIASKLVRVMIHVLGDVPPSVPPRGVPLASVLRSTKRRTKETFCRYINSRYRRGLLVWDHFERDPGNAARDHFATQHRS